MLETNSRFSVTKSVACVIGYNPRDHRIPIKLIFGFKNIVVLCEIIKTSSGNKI